MHENYLVQNKGRPVGQAMNKHDVLRSIFLLFSVSTSVQDLELYGGQAGVGPTVNFFSTGATKFDGEV